MLVWHRRAGKSVAVANHLIRDALDKPDRRYAYIAPFYSMAKNIAWDVFKKYVRPVPDVKINEAELSIDFPNGSKIRLYGSDRPDALRGMGLDGVVFDEFAMQRSNIYSEIIRPALTDKKGYAVWIGTPLGMNTFYQLYKNASKQENWYASLLTVNDTNILDAVEVEDAKKVMSEDEFQQEFMCSFNASIKGAYYATELSKVRSEKRIGDYIVDPKLPVHTAWDLGVGDSTAIWFFQDIGTSVLLLDYFQSDGHGVDFYINVLRQKKYNYGTHFAPHDIEVQEFGTGLTRLETARRLGINFRVVGRNSIEDGINAVRLLMSRMYFHTRCEDALNLLAQYQKEWDEKNHIFRDRPLHNFASHCGDSLRYLAMARRMPRMQTEKQSYLPTYQKPTDLDELFGPKKSNPITPKYGNRK